jgi:exopolyphosphatase / guanosine-5'-triphosphate,3'-diphosphate pyrophosphatase
MSLLDRLARGVDPGTQRLASTGRRAIIDIGSNSVRLVVYEGPDRLPFTLFNEKIMAGLGSALDRTGRIEDDAMARGLAALERFARLCTDMQVVDVRCVATAAVRDASNGGEFIARAASLGLLVDLLTGEQEARTSAFGLLSGMPDADGIMGDLGGGSLELVRVRDGQPGEAISLPLGVLRLAEIRRDGKGALTKRFNTLLKGSLPESFTADLPFYMVGGSWRALARLDMQLVHYPLPVFQHYEMTTDRVARLRQWLAKNDREQLRALPSLSGSRIVTLPDAAALLDAVTRRLGSSRLVVSAFGLREGLLFESLAPDVAAQDPLLISARAEGDAQGRFVGHGDVIGGWIAPLFAQDDAAAARIRLTACLLADVGWRANPEFRAERGVEIALHGNWVGINANERALLAQALHSSFGGGLRTPPALSSLAPTDQLRRAAQWGLAIRLCQRLSGGAESPLVHSRIGVIDGTIVLSLDSSARALAGEAVERRLRQLGQAMGMGFVLDA